MEERLTQRMWYQWSHLSHWIMSVWRWHYATVKYIYFPIGKSDCYVGYFGFNWCVCQPDFIQFLRDNSCSDWPVCWIFGAHFTLEQLTYRSMIVCASNLGRHLAHFSLGNSRRRVDVIPARGTDIVNWWRPPGRIICVPRSRFYGGLNTAWHRLSVSLINLDAYATPSLEEQHPVRKRKRPLRSDKVWCQAFQSGKRARRA